MQTTIALCCFTGVTPKFQRSSSLCSQIGLCGSCSDIHIGACSCRTKREGWAEMLSEAGRVLATLPPWLFPWHLPHIRAGLGHWQASPKEEVGEAAAEKA